MFKSISIKKNRYVMLISYFFVMATIVLFIAIIPMYYFISSKMTQMINISNESLLQQVKANVDQTLNKIDSISLRIITDSQLSNILFKINNSLYDNMFDYYSEFDKFAKTIEYEHQSNQNIINSIYVYLPKPQIIIYNNLYIQSNEFNDMEFIENTIDLKKNTGWNGPRRIVKETGNSVSMPEGNVVSYFRKLFPGENIVSDVLVDINIDVDVFYKLIGGIDKNQNLQFFMANSKGDVVASYNTNAEDNVLLAGVDPIKFKLKEKSWEQNFNNKRVLVSSIMSDYNDWRYIVLVPKADVLAPLEQARKTAVVSLLVCFFLGGILSVFFSKSYYSPIKRIVKEFAVLGVNDKKIQIDDFELLKNAFNGLKNQNLYSHEILKENWNELKDKYIIDVLSGNITDEGDLFGLGLKYKFFRVVCLEINNIYKTGENIPEINKSIIIYNAERICIDTLASLADRLSITTTKVNNELIVFIFNYETVEYEKNIDDLTGNLQRNVLLSDMSIGCTIGIGKRYDNSKSIQNSYKEALKALEYKMFMGNNSIIKFDYEKFNLSPNYNEGEFINQKKLLIENIRMKNRESVIEIIDGIRNWSYSLSPDYFERLKFVFVTLCQEIAELVYIPGENNETVNDMYEVYIDIGRTKFIEDLTVILNDQSLSAVDFLIYKTEKINNEVIDNILLYIKQHITEDFSIERLAEKAKLHPVYLGRLIKNVTGLTFPQYITQLRMEKVKSLLENSDLNVKDIYEQVGYSNRQSFIRAFKATFGITPSEYKQSKIRF